MNTKWLAFARVMICSLALLVWSTACGDDTTEGAECRENETQLCSCPDGTESSQACGANGQFSSCQCGSDLGASDSSANDAGASDSGGVADTSRGGDAQVDSSGSEDATSGDAPDSTPTDLDLALPDDLSDTSGGNLDTGSGGDADTAISADLDMGGGVIPSGRPIRGGDFMGTTERFNRYYTDPDYVPTTTIYASRTGAGSGTSAEDPASVDAAFAQVEAGERIYFIADETPYAGCWELDSDSSGTYDDPIVLYAERNPDNTRGVHILCCADGRRSCFNLEGANYVAIDGFELEGGRYGIRAVGLGYAAGDHQVGIAMIDNEGFDQDNDPFFTGQSDWIAVEDNVAHGADTGDGHGIYLSNGSDWMVVRGNDLYDNSSSDFQINADPASTCADVDIPYDDTRCDGSALDGLGQGVSEFILVENNYFHAGLRESSSGPNFTSVRNSVIRNNIIGFYSRHGTSFWQETDNPRLGSSDNLIHHNLFIGERVNRHVLQFAVNSDRNDVRNNVFLGLTVGDDAVTANSDVILIESDGTTSANVFENNYYAGGTFDGHTPTDSETVNASVDAAWFTSFPFDRMGTPTDYRPAAGAPFLDAAAPPLESPVDLAGATRANPADLGPLER